MAVTPKLESELPNFHANANELQQVLINLLTNARDAVLSTAKPVKEISVITARSQEHLYLKVVDQGSGMEQKVIDRIFDPFFTTKEVGLGTGLGLSISKEILDKNNGSIQIESEPGLGTTITLEFKLDDSISPST